MNGYQEFLKEKISISQLKGFKIDRNEINPMLKPHQKDIVVWAIAGGRRAIFAAFGLGKTFIQLEILRLIQKYHGGNQLTIAPLGVRQEFKIDAVKLGIEITFLRRSEEVSGPGIYITNYESVRDGKLDITLFNGVSLDEASVLRSYGSKTFQTFLTLFQSVKYRFVATATPSPNRYKELIHYGGFLGVMDTGQALTRFFKRDSTQANNLQIHPHKETEFWLWLSSWAIFLQKPSDLGYSNEGYDLPKLNVFYHKVEVNELERFDKRDGQRFMFGDASLSLSDASKEKRNSLDNRVEQIRLICYDLRKSFNLKGFNNESKSEETIPEGLLSEEQKRIDRKTENENQEEPRISQQISEKILYREQRSFIKKAEGERSEELPGKERNISQKIKELGEKQQRENVKTSKVIKRKEFSTPENIPERVLSEQQRESGTSIQVDEVEIIRTDSGFIRKHDGDSKSCLHDLQEREHREESIPLIYRSLPRDRKSEGAALSSMQCGSGMLQGQSRPAHESEELPDQIVIWCDLNAEQKAIEKMLKKNNISYVSLYGATPIDKREGILKQWLNKEKTVFLSKPDMYGSGINLQQCHTMIFAGIGFKFNSFIQAIHRVYRFLQDKECNIHIIYASTEATILSVLKKKWNNHNIMVEKMTKLIKKYGLSHSGMAKELERSIGIERLEVKGENFVVANNDCVDECKRIKSDSIGLIHTSIPFSNHYEYTPCHDEQTEVLTQRGWISFEHLKKTDFTATVNQATLEMEWQNPTDIIWNWYEGDMLYFYERGIIDSLVTPDHKMFIDTRVGNHLTGRKHQSFNLLQADKIYKNFVYRKWKMLSAVKNKRHFNNIKFVKIPEADSGERGPKAKKINPIPIKDFLILAGWYLSEGSCDPISDLYSKHDGRISISQCNIINPLNSKEIKDLFIKIGLNPNQYGRNITVHSKSLSLFLVKHFGSNSHYKFIPTWVKELSSEYLSILRDTMMKGDGNLNGMAYTSYSKQLQDDFQEVCFMTGWRSSISEKFKTVRISQTRNTPELRRKPTKIYYRGMIGCASVPNRTLVTRRNGKILVSGNSYNDFGHTENNNHFWKQMDFLTPELLRILKPGRIYACHVKDRILFGNVTGKGAPTVSPFHMEATFHAMKHGFDYLGMITVVTDVVRENNQTYRLGWSEQCKDGSKMGVGSPEYILILRKPQTDRTKGYADEKIQKTKEDYTRAQWQVDAHAFWRSSGDRLLDPDELASLPTDKFVKKFKEHSLDNIYDYDHHIEIGEKIDAKGKLPSTFMSIAPESCHKEVWTDINRMITLNSQQARRKLSQHICPLQLDIVKRIVNRYSNKGDIVCDPFGGIFSVPYQALKMERKAISCELNPQYFLDGVKYCEMAEHNDDTQSLFNFLESA